MRISRKFAVAVLALAVAVALACATLLAAPQRLTPAPRGPDAAPTPSAPFGRHPGTCDPVTAPQWCAPAPTPAPEAPETRAAPETPTADTATADVSAPAATTSGVESPPPAATPQAPPAAQPAAAVAAGTPAAPASAAARSAVPAPPQVVDVTVPGGAPTVQLSTADGGGGAGFRGRITDADQIGCTDPLAGQGTFPQCVFALPAAGTHTFQVSYFDGADWGPWSAPSRALFVGDECAGVSFVPLGPGDLTVPWDASGKAVVGYTTASASGASTGLDVFGGAGPGWTTAELSSGQPLWALPYSLTITVDPSGSDPTLPPGVQPVAIYVSAAGSAAAAGTDTLRLKAAYAFLDSGTGCRVDADIAVDLVRTAAAPPTAPPPPDPTTPPVLPPVLPPPGTDNISPECPTTTADPVEGPDGQPLWGACMAGEEGAAPATPGAPSAAPAPLAGPRPAAAPPQTPTPTASPSSTPGASEVCDLRPAPTPAP